MNKKFSRFLTILLIIIIMTVIGLCGYLGYTFIHNQKTQTDAKDAVDAFKQENTIEIVSRPNGGTAPGNVAGQNNTIKNETTNSSGNLVLDTSPTTNTNTSGQGTVDKPNTTTNPSTSQKPTFKGFNQIGTIEIPKINLSYPILEKVTKSSLEASVAVIYPFENPEVNIIGNVVIVGHNYRNGTFFSNNKKISKGDSIYITGLDKKRVEYIVYNIFEAEPEDASFYNRDTNGKREVTLSTCTDDVAKRLIIEAREK